MPYEGDLVMVYDNCHDKNKKKKNQQQQQQKISFCEWQKMTLNISQMKLLNLFWQHLMKQKKNYTTLLWNVKQI